MPIDKEDYTLKVFAKGLIYLRKTSTMQMFECLIFIHITIHFMV